MQKEILQNMLDQNQVSSSFAFNKLNPETIGYRLNEEASSAGFIYRHIGETMNLFGTFFGMTTTVQNTTMGETDKGQGNNLTESRQLVEKGYKVLTDLINNTPDAEWLEPVNTPFFGTIPRIRLFSHILFHNSHHAGQISQALSKGERKE